MVNFEEILRMNAAGNSNITLNYSCTDDNPLGGYSYYRLKIVDLDGEVQYSNPRMVYRSALTESPTLNGTEFDLSSCESGALIKIFDASGKLLVQKIADAPNYDIQHLQNGFYLVHIICNRNEYIFKTSIAK
jgi:hypothetical protein